MTLLVTLVVIYIHIHTYTVFSNEVLPNYQVQRSAIHTRFPNWYRDSFPNLCLMTNFQNVCLYQMEFTQPNTAVVRKKTDAEKSSIHRNLNSFVPRNSRGISNDYASYYIKKGNGNRIFDDSHNRKHVHGLPLMNRPETKNYVSVSNKKENTHYSGRESNVSKIEYSSRNSYVVWTFINALDKLQQEFYSTTYAQISAISPSDRKVNGISFALSSLFLQITLIALSTTEDPETRSEIDSCTDFHASEQDKLKIINDVLSWLPASNDGLKFRYGTRLVLKTGLQMSKRFINGATSALRIKISYVNGTEAPEILTKKLNKLVELDSGGAMRNTFDEEELSGGVCAALLSTLYVRARWRAPPTLLNGTFLFRDHEAAPNRTARMIRINDIMRYADLKEWDAEALEISYATPGLTFFLIFPRGRSLRYLAAKMSATSVRTISNRMRTLRIAATLPLYTLRMTLLLPAKLQAMGVNRLIHKNQCDGLKLSHAVQRIMFWSEAGRYAFKDDGIEWDETPDLSVTVDRPYLYYVQYHNITILNGNFVL